jgi:serine/threonine protein kinase
MLDSRTSSLAARNILIHVKKGTVNAKIADVGMSHSIYAGEYESFTGLRPIRWSAPEVLVKGPEARFSLKSDVWSFGVVLWEMFSGGRLPYYQYPDTSEVVAAVVDRRETLSKPQATPSGVFAIMKKCWSRSGTERPDFAALYDEIKIVQRQSLTQSDDLDVSDNTST